MPKTMSLKQLAANRRNAQHSTGPKTAVGRAVSKLNALKHGILSTQVLVRGRHGKESPREFAALHQRFAEALRPEGPLEELLVDQIVTAHWRLRRALTVEAGEIALSVDTAEWKRREVRNPCLLWMEWEAFGDPIHAMRKSALGNAVLERWLQEARQAVERDGELIEATVQKLVAEFGDKPNVLTKELEALRLRLQQNPDGLDAPALRAKQKEEALAHLDRELRLLAWRKADCEKRDEDLAEARQAAAVLPALPVLDKILRYETKLERQMFRAMSQLERLQRMRQGEAIPAPLTMEVSERA